MNTSDMPEKERDMLRTVLNNMNVASIVPDYSEGHTLAYTLGSELHKALEQKYKDAVDSLSDLKDREELKFASLPEAIDLLPSDFGKSVFLIFESSNPVEDLQKAYEQFNKSMESIQMIAPQIPDMYPVPDEFPVSTYPPEYNIPIPKLKKMIKRSKNPLEVKRLNRLLNEMYKLNLY